MTKMEETFKVNVERSKADLEALKAKVERSKAELEEALKAEAKRSKVELEEALRAEVKRSKEVEERLKADLNAERKRVQLKEENSAKASAVFKDNMAEVKSFIANGVCLATVRLYALLILCLFSASRGHRCLLLIAMWSKEWMSASLLSVLP